MAHRLFDRVGRQFGMLRQQRPLVGMVDEHIDGPGQLVAGGVGAREQQAARQHAQFGGVEPIAFVLCADQIGQQIVGRVVSPAGDHLVDVIVEFAPRAHDERFVDTVGIESEGGEYLVGPQREQLPVLAGRAE